MSNLLNELLVYIIIFWQASILVTTSLARKGYIQHSNEPKTELDENLDLIFLMEHTLVIIS